MLGCPQTPGVRLPPLISVVSRVSRAIPWCPGSQYRERQRREHLDSRELPEKSQVLALAKEVLVRVFASFCLNLITFLDVLFHFPLP